MTDSTLLAACPSLNTWGADTALSWANAYGQLFVNPIFKSVAFINPRTSDLVLSRTCIVEEALKQNVTHTFWFDSDITFPSDIVHRLYKQNLPIVAAIGRVKQEEYATYAFDMKGKNVDIRTKVAPLVQLSYTGFGCMLVETEVFRRLGLPWFGGFWDQDNNWRFEDYFFCARAREEGYEIWGDVEASRLIGHQGNCTYWHDCVALMR